MVTKFFYGIAEIPVAFSWCWRCETFQKPVLIQNETIVSESTCSGENLVKIMWHFLFLHSS